MKKIRGFLLKHRVNTLFRCVLRRNRTPRGYHRLGSPPTCTISKLISWVQRLKSKARAICCQKPGPGYLHLGQDPVQEKALPVPKGHMAVYVRQEDGDFQRVLVPVIYINHPLFGKLLREAEEEYGYDHPGGITIPCRISEFESVQTRIAAGRGCRKTLTWK
ncbi:hypothetical protein RJ640_006772 [Escallonia rubra]|uniref:Small auxin up regulated protein n=1 Tax=Escallonia rubra TaxID=112253 RepID=A0AA88UC37_9ASTE|nr:hypothetical protein RJ640_006772 [Escallonia rubra]